MVEIMVRTMRKDRTVKKLTDTPEWRWSDTLHEWQRLHPVEGVWVTDHRPLPNWFLEDSGIVTDARFVEICQNVETLVELKQQLYWMSFGELKERRAELFGETQLGKPKIPESSNISDDGVLGYDPMQALLESQQYREYEPQRQFQTSEGSRFRAKH